jgi:hypothetical protein
VADAAGAGVAVAVGVAEGLAVGEDAGEGVCARAAPPGAIATTAISATTAERKVLIRFIEVFSIPPSACGVSRPMPAKGATILNTRGLH